MQQQQQAPPSRPKRSPTSSQHQLQPHSKLRYVPPVAAVRIPHCCHPHSLVALRYQSVSAQAVSPIIPNWNQPLLINLCVLILLLLKLLIVNSCLNFSFPLFSCLLYFKGSAQIHTAPNTAPSRPPCRNTPKWPRASCPRAAKRLPGSKAEPKAKLYVVASPIRIPPPPSLSPVIHYLQSPKSNKYSRQDTSPAEATRKKKTSAPPTSPVLSAPSAIQTPLLLRPDGQAQAWLLLHLPPQPNDPS